MSEYIKFQEYLGIVKHNYINAIASYNLLDEMKRIIAPNIVGEEMATENVKTINRFNSFFLTTMNALNSDFFIYLAKILDKHNDEPISIWFLLKYIKNHKDKFTIADIKEFNKDNPSLEILIKRHEGITDSDIQKIDNKLKELESEHLKIKTIRDKYLVHEDKIKPSTYITEDEIMKVFNLIAEILDIFSLKTNGSCTTYKKIKDDCKTDINTLVKQLKEFQKYRKKEWEEKYIK